ncbi:MAG: CBS domain-containing protein [Candidatus Marinimicrobia bacterium]|nr:CBS domain-containing protein [Candidatus Neomarinimicrobiota bacterium]
MKKPMSVKNYMASELITFKPETNVLAAIRTLLEHKISGAPVVDETGWIVGIISEYDCLKPNLESSYHNDMGNLVKDIMSSKIRTIDANASLTQAAELFIKHGVRRLPVVENKKLIGQISRRDVLHAINESVETVE